jgi:hypothetical protein
LSASQARLIEIALGGTGNTLTPRANYHPERPTVSQLESELRFLSLDDHRTAGRQLSQVRRGSEVGDSRLEDIRGRFTDCLHRHAVIFTLSAQPLCPKREFHALPEKFPGEEMPRTSIDRIDMNGLV